MRQQSRYDMHINETGGNDGDDNDEFDMLKEIGESMVQEETSRQIFSRSGEPEPKKKQVKFDESIESSIYEQETDGKPSIQYDDLIKTKEISSKPI